MYFDLDEEQRAFVRTVEEFAAREIAPGAVERDRDCVWYAEGWRKMAQLGLLGLQFPEEYGGSGASVLTTAAAFQAFTAGGADAGIALSWIAHSVLAGTPLWLFGTEEQQRRYLARIATGEWTAGYGLTEPNAGSDASSLQTTAVQRGDRWILNGSKMFITNAPVGDLFVVFASEDRSLGSRGITAFIVERGFPGFSSGRELDKMGNRTSPTGELIFQDCEVPAENVLGERRKGFDIAKAALEWERFLMMAHSVGTMQATYRECLRYAAERRQFGKPILEQPAIQAKLADMRLNIAAGELFVRRVAWLKDRQRATPLESSSCKIFCSGAVMQTAMQGVQVLGGYGYLRESPVERNMRDAKLAEIGGGTTEIQRQVVGRSLLKARDQRWDCAYGPEQAAARCRPSSDAPDLVGACLAVAELARRGPLGQALAAMADETVRRTVGARDLPCATYTLSGNHVLNAQRADILVCRDRLLTRPTDWDSQAIAQDSILVPEAGIAEVTIHGRGEPVESDRLQAISRLFLAAVATGLAEAALDEALSAARELPGEGQLIEFKLADLRTRLDGARMLIHRAAELAQHGSDALPAARMARIFAAEAAVFCTEQAVAIAGPFHSQRLQALQRDCHVPAGLDTPLAEERLALVTA
jgi:alkylation response protein AidB-like acyl-CoA dehydrogenase